MEFNSTMMVVVPYTKNVHVVWDGKRHKTLELDMECFRRWCGLSPDEALPDALFVERCDSHDPVEGFSILKYEKVEYGNQYRHPIGIRISFVDEQDSKEVGGPCFFRFYDMKEYKAFITLYGLEIEGYFRLQQYYGVYI